MNLDLPYNFDKRDMAADITAPEITVQWLTSAVSQKYPQGLEGQLQRIWGRIQRKLDASILAKTNAVELETAEIDFIKKSFEGAKFLANFSKYINVLEDEIQKLGSK